jgi:diguanylate cyclase (GGDEF)-like protein
VELAREIARARRTEQALVVAFVDVDKLKDINDSEGHAAGDRTIRAVADALRSSLRSYDLVIRYGGDEFVCAMSGLDLAAAGERMAQVNVVLEGVGRRSVSVGLAQLGQDDSLDSLVARADTALYASRVRHGAPPLSGSERSGGSETDAALHL